MKEQKKKQLITALLLISCFISGYMLFISSSGETKRLLSVAQADSLIQKELTSFNISDAQIRTSSVRVDSNFSRKKYFIRVPETFSKTQLHAELNSIFYKYPIETPAKVSFTDNKIEIHLLYSGTVIRTISLQTDPDLTPAQSRASILVLFNSFPERKYINKLASLGEPMPMVLKIENAMQAKTLTKRLGNRYRHLIFWLQSEEGEDLITTHPSAALPKLKQLHTILPAAHLLKLGQWNIDKAIDGQKSSSNSALAFINAEDAPILSEEMGKNSFFGELDKLKQNRRTAIAIIRGNGTTLSWLSKKLPDLQKAGINLVTPKTGL